MSSPSITDRPKPPISNSGSGPAAAPSPQGSVDETSIELTSGAEGLRRTAQFATIGIFIILLGAFLQAGRVFLLPIACAITIGVMLSPLARRAERYRVPATVFALFAVIFFIVLIQFALVAVAAPLISVLAHASDIGDNIRQKLELFDPVLDSWRTLQNTIAPGAAEASGASVLKLDLDLSSVAQPAIGFLTPAAGEVVIFLATLFLYLVSRDTLRRNLILTASGSDARLRAIRLLNEIEQKMVQYIGTVAVISLVLGALTALGTYLLGYPNPLLLGALEFVCAFVPYLGAAFMTVVLFCVGLISFSTWYPTLIAVALFVAMVTCEGQFITPSIFGARFTTSPLTMFLALAFWTWLWGPVGTFLSVPFVLIGVAIFNHFLAADEAELPR
jgi:predicted PurR-regulated permease PerM